MIFHFEASLDNVSVHYVGNKSLDENLTLSEHALKISDVTLTSLLINYFLTPFEKVNEIYRFFHSTENLDLNEVFHFAEMIFNRKGNFHQNSKQIAKCLYSVSDHPRVKPGELYVCYFKDLQIEGALLDAIGIFKSESKEPFLKVTRKDKEFEISYESEAISTKKLDKGCLIFNIESDLGYKVAVVDQTNRAEAVFWIDDFLKLKVRNDNYTYTHDVLHAYKNFVTEKMDEGFDISKTDKIDLLNRSIKYFKEKDYFDLDEFSNDVIANPEGIELFKNYKKQYEQEFETRIEDSFEISNVAVKKQARVYKSVLKLDRNFHIYIHGPNELIERGVEKDGRKYYKIYFNEEK